MSNQKPQLHIDESRRLRWKEWREENVSPSVTLAICVKGSRRIGSRAMLLAAKQCLNMLTLILQITLKTRWHLRMLSPGGATWRVITSLTFLQNIPRAGKTANIVAYLSLTRHMGGLGKRFWSREIRRLRVNYPLISK